MVKMKATDQLFISSVGPDTLAPGEAFDVSEEQAAILEKGGLAKRAGGKAEDAPENKMEAAPEDKALSAESVKAPAKRKGK